MGSPRGVIEYIPLPGKIIAAHTEVAQPMCPYVAAWLRRHPDESDVVDVTAPH